MRRTLLNTVRPETHSELIPRDRKFEFESYEYLKTLVRFSTFERIIHTHGLFSNHGETIRLADFFGLRRYSQKKTSFFSFHLDTSSLIHLSLDLLLIS